MMPGTIQAEPLAGSWPYSISNGHGNTLWVILLQRCTDNKHLLPMSPRHF